MERGFARSDHAVASVELGNEIMGGAGTTWIERFEVDADVAPRVRAQR